MIRKRAAVSFTVSENSRFPDPRSTGKIISRCRSDDNGATRSGIRATYEPFNQSYHLAVAADDPARLATGLQDNGSFRTWTATAEPSDLTQWTPTVAVTDTRRSVMTKAGDASTSPASDLDRGVTSAR